MNAEILKTLLNAALVTLESHPEIAVAIIHAISAAAHPPAAQ